jgi:hypothetical protein
MSQVLSTGEIFSHTCEHCGRQFYLRPYVNRHGKTDVSAPRKYCDTPCRKDAYRVRRGHPRSVPRVDDTEALARSVPTPTLTTPPSDAGYKTDPRSAFERLQGDAVLSDWRPHVTLETDIPDIPEFLRRR